MLANLCLATLVLSSTLRLIGAAASNESEHCPTIKADFARRQLEGWGSSTPFTIVDGGDGDDKAKHVPVLTVSDDGTQFTIVVGNGNEDNGVWHPQVASDDPNTVHFVTHIYAEDQDGNVVFMKTVNPEDGAPATVTGDIPPGVTQLIPFEFCNLHGLWIGDAVSISSDLGESDGVISCGESESLQWSNGAWSSLHADFEKQQKVTYGSDSPFTESDSQKHTPYITVNGDGTASVLVGSVEGEIHPMVGSTDGSGDVHWITEIYVVDDQGNIITLKALDPTGVDRATLDFEVPDNAKTLTAIIWCNIHGLYTGPTVEVASEDTSVADQSGGSEEQKSSNSRAFVPVTSSLIAATLGFFF